VSPRVTPKRVSENGRSSYAEFRSRNGRTAITDRDSIFWRYATLRPYPSLGFAADELSEAEWFAAEGIGSVEQRVLSKASGAAGGFLAPSDFADEIIETARLRGTVARLAREFVTTSGETLPVPTTTAHGTASWTAENAAVSASDETFGQASLSAFKASTKVIFSEELANDSAVDLDGYLAEEFGLRIARLSRARPT
jgi:HK97 family phage major capsid protein